MAVSPLVSPTWLRQQLLSGLKGLRVLDASFSLGGRNPREEFLKERIDGATFFDIDEVSDKLTPYPHMLPSAEQFSNHVGKLGVGNDNHVIVYDNSPDHGLFSAPRVWWMFRVFGHHDVSVLDGGLPRWKFRGYPTIRGPPPVTAPTDFSPAFNPGLVRTFEQMMENCGSKKEQVVDARSEARFNGTALEPRPELRSGHMTGAHNVPYMSLISPDGHILKSKHLLQEEFEKAGVDLSRPMVASCGSGITAGIVAFGAFMLGREIPVYDGSWSEWVQRAPEDTMELGAKAENIPKDG